MNGLFNPQPFLRSPTMPSIKIEYWSGLIKLPCCTPALSAAVAKFTSFKDTYAILKSYSCLSTSTSAGSMPWEIHLLNKMLRSTESCAVFMSKKAIIGNFPEQIWWSLIRSCRFAAWSRVPQFSRKPPWAHDKFFIVAFIWLSTSNSKSLRGISSKAIGL